MSSGYLDMLVQFISEYGDEKVLLYINGSSMKMMPFSKFIQDYDGHITEIQKSDNHVVNRFQSVLSAQIARQQQEYETTGQRPVVKNILYQKNMSDVYDNGNDGTINMLYAHSVGDRQAIIMHRTPVQHTEVLPERNRRPVFSAG